MKKNAQNSIMAFSVIAMIFIAFAFTACEGGQNRTAKQKLDETKQQAIQNINKYKNDIQERIDYIEQEMETATEEVKVKLAASREELKAQKEILEQDLQNVRNATLETWNSVVKESSDKLTKARTKMNEVSKNVRTWLDEEE